MDIDQEKISRIPTKSVSFHYFNEEKNTHLSEVCSYVTYNSQEIIFSELQPANSFYVIEKGTLT